MYKNDKSARPTLQFLSKSLSALLHLTGTMNNIVIFYIFTTITLGLTKRIKPVLPARIPATSLNTSDTDIPCNFLIDDEVHKAKIMLGTETWFRPCDCGGPGWEKIAFFDFSIHEYPSNFDHSYGIYNNVSYQINTNNRYDCDGRQYYSTSIPLPVKGRSYSSVCGRVRGHGLGNGFVNAIACNYSLEQPYVSGVSLTHGPAGRRRHIWTFAAAWADGDPDPHNTQHNCGCSNTNLNWTYTTPDDVGRDYFCDSYQQYTKGGRWLYDEDDDLWDGEGCGSSSSCCESRDPPYFCKKLHNTTSEDIEIRLLNSMYYYNSLLYFSPTLSLVEIFVM